MLHPGEHLFHADQQFGLGSALQHLGAEGAARRQHLAGEFGREFTLPVPVDLERTSATYLDGLLSIVLPIAATAYIPTARNDVRIIVQRIVI